MEPTNELITKSEAYAEGFSVVPNNMIHSEGDSKNNNSQWIFPDENLDAQAGNYLLTVSQPHKLYLVSVFYITQ